MMRRRTHLAGYDHELQPLEARALLSLPPPPAADLLYAAPQGVGIQGARIADLDGDGLGDAVLFSGDKLVVRRYDGHGSFLPAQTSSLPANPARFRYVYYGRSEVGDFDGNGSKDILVEVSLQGIGGRYYERMWLLNNDGAGNLHLALTMPDSYEFSHAYLSRTMDIDGDGSEELLDFSGRAWGIVNGALAVKTTVAAEVASGRLVDFDGDGDLDALGLRSHYTLGVVDSVSIVLQRNEGRAGFVMETLLTVARPDIHQFALGEVTGDGVKDLLLWGEDTQAPSRTLSVFVAPSIDGAFVLDPTPVYSESIPHIRGRGGHAAVVPDWPYEYNADLQRPILEQDIGGDARPDISFDITSTQTWNYRPTSAEVFSERFPVELIASGPADGFGVPEFTARPGTPPTPEYISPRPSGSLADGDIDGDGKIDSIINRGDAGRPYGGRLAYVHLSSERLPVAAITALYKNGVGTSSISLAVGDRLRVLVKVIPDIPTRALAPARLFIDSNNNGILDGADMLLRIGVEQAVITPAGAITYSFNVIRRANWGGPGVRALFFVPYTQDGTTGVPVTWMVNLL